MSSWRIFKGTGEPHDGITRLPSPPPWREFGGGEASDGGAAAEPLAGDELRLPTSARTLERGRTFQVGDEADAEAERDIDLVNAALILRRPLLVTGPPGTGKSSLAYAVAYELQLGDVLKWPIASHATLKDALYRYDAVGRLQDTEIYRHAKGTAEDGAAPKAPDIGDYVRLGPLGTAFLPHRYPRVLLIDEIDKSDIDLPNDLLNVFEEGEFVIPELARLKQPFVDVLTDDSRAGVALVPDRSSGPTTGGETRARVMHGRVACRAFPFVVITSNGERELPPAFLRRCLRLDIKKPSKEKLARIVRAHFQRYGASDVFQNQVDALVDAFLARRERGLLATDQLLNAIHLTNPLVVGDVADADKSRLVDAVLRLLDDDRPA